MSTKKATETMSIHNASYEETYMLDGRIDGVVVDAKLHHDSTRRIRELCKREPAITQCTHDSNSARRFEDKVLTKSD